MVLANYKRKNYQELYEVPTNPVQVFQTIVQAFQNGQFGHLQFGVMNAQTQQFQNLMNNQNPPEN